MSSDMTRNWRNNCISIRTKNIGPSCISVSLIDIFKRARKPLSFLPTWAINWLMVERRLLCSLLGETRKEMRTERLEPMAIRSMGPGRRGRGSGGNYGHWLANCFHRGDSLKTRRRGVALAAGSRNIKNSHHSELQSTGRAGETGFHLPWVPAVVVFSLLFANISICLVFSVYSLFCTFYRSSYVECRHHVTDIGFHADGWPRWRKGEPVTSWVHREIYSTVYQDSTTMQWTVLIFFFFIGWKL